MYFVISLFYVSFSSSFSGSFDILFYDGFKKTVQGINIKTMPKDVQQQVSTVNKGVSQPEGSEVKGSNVLGVFLDREIIRFCRNPCHQKND